MITAANLRRLRRLPRSTHAWEGDLVAVDKPDACLAIWLDANAPAIRALDTHAGRASGLSP
jgi:hypothetical protein